MRRWRWLLMGLVAIVFLNLDTRAARAELRGWWKFDASTNLGLDSSPAGNSLAPVGNPQFNAGGRFGGALSLDGFESALTGSPFPAVPTGDDPYSISAWIKPNSFTNGLGRPPGIVGWGNYGTVRQVNAFRLGGSNSLNNYWWGADIEIDANAAGINLSDGGWHHVATSYDGTVRRLFADGQEIGRDTPGDNDAADVNFFIGKTCHGCGFGEEWFDGLLDDIAIFDFGLSQLDAQALRAGLVTPATLVHQDDPPPPPPPPPSLVSLWRFDDGADLGKDSHTTGNNLTVQGDVVFDAAGVRGGAADFNGFDGFLEDPDGFPDGVPVGNDPYTLAAWIQPRSTGARGIVGWGGYQAAGGARHTNALRTKDDNGFRHYWWGADLDAQDADVDAAGVDLDDGQWHHVAATYDGQTRALYLNGELLVSDSPGTNNARAENFAVGLTCIACSFGEEYWDGLLDELAIFKGGLSQEQIGKIMGGDFSVFQGIRGDFNSNAQLDAGDLDLLAQGQLANDLAFDLNGDGITDYDDRLVWVRDLKKTWVGDADLNGEFNTGDLVQVFQLGKFETGQAAGWDAGDWNGDAVFGTGDLVVAFQDGGFEKGTRAATSAVPEPTAALLVGTAALAIALVRRQFVPTSSG